MWIGLYIASFLISLLELTWTSAYFFSIVGAISFHFVIIELKLRKSSFSHVNNMW